MLVTFLLVAAQAGFAADTKQFRVVVTMCDDGTERLTVHDPNFPTNAPQAKVDAYLRGVVSPKIQADAAKGIEPAVWQIGYFYLNGWGGPPDLQRAEAAFRAGPKSERGRGLWRVGHGYMWEKRDYAKAEALFMESFDAGCKWAARDAALLARAHLYGWWKLKCDRAKAEALLQKIGTAYPDSRTYLLSLTCLRYEQKKFAEAYEIATQVAPKLRERPEDYRLALSIRFISAVRAGKLSELKPEEAIELLQGMNSGRGWLLPLALAVLMSVLAVLVLWTYLARQRGPGLVLSGAWISVALVAAGLGFSLPLPVALDCAAGRWMGAILMAAVCLIAARLGGGARYFGTTPLAPDLRSALRVGGVLVALLAGMLAVGSGYEFLYKQITGRPLDSQLVGLLLKCTTTSDFVITLTVAGLLIPFYEEIVFRGFLFGALERRWGGVWALGISSIVFALIHGLTHLPVLTFVALALGWLRLRTGDLRQSILLHCANNTLAILVLNIFGQ